MMINKCARFVSFSSSKLFFESVRFLPHEATIAEASPTTEPFSPISNRRPQWLSASDAVKSVKSGRISLIIDDFFMFEC